ncbi:MAG TPA: hydrogenase maturation nickel metallochaperone HypA [Wenzhouxiangellaceae bacterium]|nr:hydrogenase maturation nickel metallochaperone HypA [Wenzhouxiangellaceae bacterium]
MHEMAVCNELLDQVRANAMQHGARSVGAITVRIGALSGVEPDLLERAFTIARAGDYTDNASLVIEPVAVRVRCRTCGNENDAAANRLLCEACGGYAVDLVGGDELLLASIELHGIPDSEPPARHQNAKGQISEGEDSYV